MSANTHQLHPFLLPQPDKTKSIVTNDLRLLYYFAKNITENFARNIFKNAAKEQSGFFP